MKFPGVGNFSSKFNKATNPTFMPKLRKNIHRFGTGWKGWRMAERYDPTGFLNEGGFGKATDKDPFMYHSILKPFATNQFNAGKNFLKNRSEHGWKLNDGDRPAVDTDTKFKMNEAGKVVQDSSFGGMLSMFGGIKALDPLKEPFKEKTTVLPLSTWSQYPPTQ